MSKFVRITGASKQEARWFSKACNALGANLAMAYKCFEQKHAFGPDPWVDTGFAGPISDIT